MKATNVLRRRVLLASALAVAATAANPQANKKLPKIAFLFGGPKLPRESPFWVQWFNDMERLGWKEDRDFVFDFRVAEGDYAKLDALAAELAVAGVDVILAGLDNDVAAARRANPKTPVVVCVGTDPVKAGYAASLARPGGNATGLIWAQNINIIQRSAQHFKALIPDLKQLVSLVDASVAKTSQPYIDSFEQAAKRLGCSHEVIVVSKAEDYESAFERMASIKCQAYVEHGSPMIYRIMGKLVELARRYKIADAYVIPEAVELGGLFSLGPDIVDMYRRTAGFVDKILKGAKPGDLPIELPTKYDLVINSKTAKELGITIPRSLRFEAQRIIE